jgi:hypothetical protein
MLKRAAEELTRDKSGTQQQLKVMSNELDSLVEGVVGVQWS